MLGLGSDDDAVDPLVRKAAAWSWRLLVIFGAILALVWLIARLEVIVVPVALAVILCALLLPAVDWLDGRGAPRGLQRHHDFRCQPICFRSSQPHREGHPQH
jgi:hypothetical protein